VSTKERVLVSSAEKMNPSFGISAKRKTAAGGYLPTTPMLKKFVALDRGPAS
jgi:hypothetical protein